MGSVLIYTCEKLHGMDRDNEQLFKGAAAIGGAFTPEIIKMMGDFNEKPVIFALSNPTSKAECTAEAAYTHTQGRCIFASGSPFLPFTYEGKTHYPGQGNNSYIFPGIALGVIAAGIKTISDDLFLISAKVLAELVQQEDLDKGRLYPPLDTIQDISLKIAVKIVEVAYRTGVASYHPEPKDKKKFVKDIQYNVNYSPSTPKEYSWPTVKPEHWYRVTKLELEVKF